MLACYKRQGRNRDVDTHVDIMYVEITQKECTQGKAGKWRTMGEVFWLWNSEGITKSVADCMGTL